MRLNSNRAGRFCNKVHHSSYGIYNYLKLISVPSEQNDEICESFLSFKGFESELKNNQLYHAKTNFIQNRFAEFKKFAIAKKELLNPK